MDDIIGGEREYWTSEERQRNLDYTTATVSGLVAAGQVLEGLDFLRFGDDTSQVHMANVSDGHGLVARGMRSTPILEAENDLGFGSDKVMKQPLWSVTKGAQDRSTYVLDGKSWQFWNRFYREMLDGTFKDWDLALEVIKIDKADWTKGVGHVGELIEGIEARMRTNLAAPLIRDDATDTFVLRAEAPLPDELFEYIKERVGGALRTALAASGNNGFHDSCEEALAIAQALQSRNPSAVAGLLTDATLMFQTNLGNRYPEDGSLIALQAAAFSGAEEICESDEVARMRCYRASKLYLSDNPPPIDPNEMQDFTSQIADETSGDARVIIDADGRAIATGKPVGRFVRARFANYAATIVKWIDEAKKGVGRVEWLWKMVRKLLDAFEDTPPD